MGHIELIEPWALAICFRNFLNRVAAGGAEGVREVELIGDFGNREFAIFVVDFIDADWSKADGGGDWRCQ